MKVLELQQLQKSFGDNQVLKGIDLYANKGDVISIRNYAEQKKSKNSRVVIFKNNRQIGEFDHGSSFRIIANCWLGDNPVSPSVKESLSNAGRVHEDVMAYL